MKVKKLTAVGLIGIIVTVFEAVATPESRNAVFLVRTQEPIAVDRF